MGIPILQNQPFVATVLVGLVFSGLLILSIREKSVAFLSGRTRILTRSSQPVWHSPYPIGWDFENFLRHYEQFGASSQETPESLYRLTVLSNGGWKKEFYFGMFIPALTVIDRLHTVGVNGLILHSKSSDDQQYVPLLSYVCLDAKPDLSGNSVQIYH